MKKYETISSIEIAKDKNKLSELLDKNFKDIKSICLESNLIPIGLICDIVEPDGSVKNQRAIVHPDLLSSFNMAVDKLAQIITAEKLGINTIKPKGSS